MRLKDNVILQSALLMLGFGVLIGVLFPFFSDVVLALPKTKVYTTAFFVVCIIAGIIVGFIGFLIIKITIIKRLGNLKDKINTISTNIQNYIEGKIKYVETCTDCFVESNKDVYELGIKYNLFISIIRQFFWQYQKSDEFYLNLSESLEIKELNNTFAKFITDNFNCLGIEIFNLDKTGNVGIVYSYLARQDLSENKKESIKNILEKGQLVRFQNPSIEVSIAVVSIKPKEVIFIPIETKKSESYLVVFYFDIYLKPDDINFFKRLMYQYSLALERSLAYEHMQGIAAIDELTGIYNRRFGMLRLSEDYSRAKRFSSPFYVMMFDIDHFKDINDAFGHQTGDYILEQVAKIIKSLLRIEDVLLRYGGDEFVAGLICKFENVLEKAQSIRNAIEKQIFLFSDLEIKVTISVGISKSQPSDEVKLESLIKESDEALYNAKGAGRNRVCAK
ncbi:diguanylate cyclase/phosphodiesterase (GGDEF / EAL domains) with PAS/PAC sensor(s) [Desulfurella amilsii]|uniref:diguanylate cyclase n=1 Tax=Desulfurella amilsii TaxID=1562698 RepID=A0A1X4XZI2_9BACT|nr:GGDEF domain-containing protein [Desulfurella amilsii]OSS42952.1 diguanylate cyclase/phosphodiesterase (GGDEF / EAL domains) with PAS/PAC sensor(s) [Desulfurella amilsii]